MCETEFLKLIESIIKQYKSDKYSQPLAHLLIDLLNNSNTYYSEKKIPKNNSNNNLANKYVDITEHNYSNNYLKKYNSNVHNVKSNIENNNEVSDQTNKLMNILKNLLNKDLDNIPIRSDKNEEDRLSISIKDEFDNDFVGDIYENNSIMNKDVDNTLNQDNFNCTTNSKSNFIKSISMENKSSNFRYTFIYEQLNQPIDNKFTDSFSTSSGYKDSVYKQNVNDTHNFYNKAPKQYVNKPDLENDKKTSLDNEEDKNIYKDETYIKNSLLTKKQQMIDKLRVFNKNNFKPLKYIKVKEPSEILGSLLRNKLK